MAQPPDPTFNLTPMPLPPQNQLGGNLPRSAPQQPLSARLKLNSAFDAFLAEFSESSTSAVMEEDSPPPDAQPPEPPAYQLENFLELIGKSSLTTDLLLVSFLPEWIKVETFRKLMDTIITQFVPDVKISPATAHHHHASFPSFFEPTPPLWMVFYQPTERHGSYLLQLPSLLTFSPTGSFQGLQFPRFSTHIVHKRPCLVQAVPRDFRETFLRSAELAFWRGFGGDYQSGLPYAITPVIEAHVEHALRSLVAAPDMDLRYRHFTYLAPHYVNIQAETTPSKQNKGKTKPGDQRRETKQHSWTECFAVTVCTVPIGREAPVFQALLPPEAPFETKLHPITLYGWRGEVASQLFLFRSWAFAPDPTLFLPQPITRFVAIRPGYSFLSLCEGLLHDYQTWEGIMYCFVQRGDTDTLTLATDGRTLSLTPSMRIIRYGGAQFDSDLPGMAAQRLSYRCFKQLEGHPTSGARKHSATRNSLTPTLALGRPSPPAPSYAAAVQRTPHTESGVRTYVQQEARLILKELTATLAQEATTMVTNAVAPLQEELQAANAKISTLQKELAENSTQTATALEVGQKAVLLVQHQDVELQAQRDQFKQLLYDTMKTAGLPLPEEASQFLTDPPAKRRPPTMSSSPMDSSK